MTNPPRTFGILSAGLLLVAFALYGYSLYRLNQYHWIVLKQAVRVEEGFTSSSSFTVDAATAYRLEVEFNRTLPSIEIDGILQQEVALTYSVRADGELVAEGDSSEPLGSSFTDTTASLIVASFLAEPHRTYNLAVRFSRSIPRLASAHPAVKVSVNPLFFKEAYTVGMLTGTLAVGVAFVGAGCLLPALWSLRWWRRRL